MNNIVRKIIISSFIIGIVIYFTNNLEAHTKQNYKNNPIIGATVDLGCGIIQNTNFDIPRISKLDIIRPDGSVGTNDFFDNNFNPKNDYAYGAAASYGYLINNNFEANLELAYHQIRNIDEFIQGSFIKSKIISGLINGVFYADIHSAIRPYLNLGGGIAHTKAEGGIVNNIPVDFGVTISEKIAFNDLKILKFAYQAGVGLATQVGSNFIGVGYKLFGVADIHDDDDDFGDLNVLSVENDGSKLVFSNFSSKLPLSFGILGNKIHNISIFAKRVI